MSHLRFFIFPAIAILLAIAPTSPSHAGFQWVPPEKTPQVIYRPQAKQVKSLPVPVTPSEKITGDLRRAQDLSQGKKDRTLLQWVSPVDTAPQTPLEQSWDDKTINSELTPIVPVRSARQPVPVTSDSGPISTSAHEVVQGFGSDLPLALALQQVVPASYAYSFADDINPGLRVSWNGGKPWDQVVSDMVAPMNMSARVDDNTVRIEKASAVMVKPQSITSSEPSIARQNIRDPGVISSGVPENTALTPLPLPPPLIPPNEMGKPVALSPATETTFTPVNAARRPRMIDQIAQDMQQENIKLRMNEANLMIDNTELPDASQPLKAGRPYEIKPYIPPSYEDRQSSNWTGSVSEKMANLGNEDRIGNKVSSGENKIWEASRGDSLKTILLAWSRDAGINMVWNSKRDYTLSSNVLVNGSFKNALKSVFNDGLGVRQKPSLQFIDDPISTNATKLVISDRG